VRRGKAQDKREKTVGAGIPKKAEGNPARFDVGECAVVIRKACEAIPLRRVRSYGLQAGIRTSDHQQQFFVRNPKGGFELSHET